MGKVTWTGRPVLSDRRPGLIVAFDVPTEYDLEVRRLSLQSVKVAGGYFSITLDLPKRPRSTGPRSQNNRANGFIRQIANWTGNSFAAVEAACKLRALDEGYPIEKALGQWVAKSQADLTVEECAAFIATIERMAAEEGIPLRED